MKSNNGKQVQCPCCKECKDCTTDFQKVVDLKNAGLVIYRHTAHTQDVNKDTGIIEYATKTTEDVFVLHNTKDIEITSADFLPEIERNTINCPRCRRIIEHALKLLQKIPTINRKDVKGICEHCRAKGAPCIGCEEVVKKFVACKSERTENTKERVRQWLSKIKHLLKDAVLDTKTDKGRVRMHSELYIDQLCRESPKLGREPEVKRMFSSESDFVGAFPLSMEKRSKMFAYFPQSETFESPVVILDPPNKFGKTFTSTTKKRLNKVDRDNVYISDEDTDDLIPIYYTPLTKKERQKHVELRIPPVPFPSEEDFIVKRDESITGFKHDILKAKRRPTNRSYMSDGELDAELKRFIQTGKATRRGDISQRREIFEVRSETTPAFTSKLYQNKSGHIDTIFSPGSAKAITEKELLGKAGELLNINRKHKSEEALLTTVASVTGEVIDQDFSYVFPKTLSPDKKKLKQQKSSSELIKETQDKLLAKAEEEKKILEEERKRKLEEEEKKKTAREESIKQLEAKRKTDEEQRRKLQGLAEKAALEVKRKEQQKETETKSEKQKKDIKEDEKDKLTKEKVTPITSIAASKKEIVMPTASIATSKTKIKENRSAQTETKSETENKDIKKERDKLTKENNTPITSIDASKKEKVTPTASIATSSTKIKENRTAPVEKSPKESKEPEDSKGLKEPKEAKIFKEQNETKELKITKGPEKPQEGKELKLKINAIKTVKDEDIAKKEQEIKEKTEQIHGEKEIKQQEKSKLQLEKGKSDKQQSKEKDDPASKPKDQQDKANRADKDVAEVRVKDELKLKFNNVKIAETEAKSDLEKSAVPKKEEETKIKALNIKSIKVRGLFSDDDNEQEKKGEKQNREKKVKDEQSIKEKELMKQIEKDLKLQEKDEHQREKVNVVIKQKGKEKEDPESKLLDQEVKAKRTEKHPPEKKVKDETKLKNVNEAKPEAKPVSEKVEAPKNNELNIKSIKVRTPSPDDLILRLVKIKQSTGADRVRNKKISEMGLFPKNDKKDKSSQRYQKTDACVMCEDSDFELNAEIVDKVADKIKKIIIGPKIFKCKPKLTDRRNDDKDVKPLIFQSKFDAGKAPAEVKEVATTLREAEKTSPVLTPGKKGQGKYAVEQEPPKGVIRYALSDRSFIDKGWTMLPTEKVVRKMNVYRMRPAQPEFDWFEHNKNKRLMLYDSGEKLAEFDDNGRGRWFYKNGRMALDYYDAEELNAQQRFVIYSSGDPDERGRAQPYTLLATFDYLGNGIVFDHSGKIRLKYNQTEGVVLDRSIGPVSHWKWHTLNDPPVLQQVMIDTQMAHKDPSILKLGGPQDDKTRPDNEDMLAIEFDNFVKEKSKKLTQTFKPFQIKMKALKINEHFSLKVLDQATVYLIFRDGSTNLKLNIGMVLDHKEIVDTDTAEVGEVSNNMERLPARTDSLAGLQKSIAHVQRYERMRTERERRLCTAAPSGSADKLTAAASRPMRLPLRTGPSGSTATATSSYCKCSRKPTATNAYYDNRHC